MRIGFIGSGLNLLSGSSKPVFQLMNVLEANGIESGMLSDRLGDPLSAINSGLEKKLDLGELRVQRLDKNIVYGLLKRDAEVARAIESFAREYDLIVCTDFLFCRLLNRNDIQRQVPFVFLASNNMEFKLRFLLDSGLPSLANLSKTSFSSKLILRRSFIERMLSQFDHVLATSSFVRNSMDYIRGTSVSALPVGVDTPPPYSRIPPGGSNSFTYFGWGSGIRGLQDVIKSFETYRDSGGTATLEVSLQGQHGFEERYYSKKIRKSKYADYINVGSYNRDIDETILSSSVVILPFRVPFGYSQPPLTILECMRLGRVVISTNIGCIPELIENNKDGFLVNPARPVEISNILSGLENGDAEIIGHNAYNRIKEECTWESLVGKYIEKFSGIKNEFSG